MKVTFAKAISAAIREEMRRDSTVLVYGEDVAEMGGIFCATEGILDEFGPKRCMSTPISEGAIVGSAIGAAMTGLRPCVELMYSDFQLVAYNELFHSCGKWRYLHGSAYKLPLVVRCAGGYSFGAGAEHSNIFECLFTHAPGLTIITPSNAYDAKGLLKSAIRSDNPVLFFEHKQLYKTKMEIPDEDYSIPIGVADIKRQGSDVTILAVGLMVTKALEAAEKLAAEGISCEVVDPRTIVPFDKKTTFESVCKTHRCVIVEESNLRNGLGAEWAAMIQEELFDELDAPIKRVASLDVPLPYNLGLEAYAVPNVDKIICAVKALF
jgi:pyruvate dehydrogenase E1 component beta subunit